MRGEARSSSDRLTDDDRTAPCYAAVLRLARALYVRYIYGSVMYGIRGRSIQPAPAARSVASEAGAPEPWSLAALHPSLAAELEREREPELDPGTLAAGSGRTVWWRCARGHSWRASVQKRVTGTGCPYCARTRAAPETSLAATRPDVTAEWHPEKNLDVLPADVLPGSGRRAWWRCAKGHEWQAMIVSRTSGHGCPACAAPGS